MDIIYRMRFHDLYEKYAPDVYRFAYWLSGSKTDAEDITSETFVRAWLGRDNIRTETDKAYLFTIARNLLLKQQRQTTRDIIIDLLPLYLTGDISDETRAVIERYLETDPKLQILMKEMQQVSPLTDIPIPLNEEHEMKTLQKIKRLTFQHNLFLALALFFIFVWFIGILLMMVDEDLTALVAGPSFFLAILFWLAFRSANRNLNQIE